MKLDLERNRQAENYTILLYLAVVLTLVLLALLQIIHCVVKKKKKIRYIISNFSVIAKGVLEILNVSGSIILIILVIIIGLIFHIAQTVIELYQSLCVLVRQYIRSQSRTRYQHILYQEEWHGWWDLETLTFMRPPGR